MQSVTYAALISFVSVLLLGPVLIPILRRLRFGQSVREEGPARHRSKAGTPTMGGILFLGTSALVSLWLGPPSVRLWSLVGVVAAFGLTGWIDDFLKVARRRSLGLRARTKLVWQIVAGTAFSLILLPDHLETWVRIPFWDRQFDLGSAYVLFVVIVFVASANAVNITDGLDGLAAGSTVIALAFFLFVALGQGALDLAIFTAALGASVAAFVFFNAYPAQVIMGDTGSLALGAALTGLAVLTKTEFFLPIVGGLFVIEALSVIVQVGYFRLTGGRRLFKMSPLHHHFELSGWTEQQVVGAFWALAMLFAGIGLLGLRGWGG